VAGTARARITLAEPDFGPLTAAKLIGEIAGAQRFSSEAKLARAAGVAPIPVSSGKTNRHRLARGGNRQINAALHRVAVTLARCHLETQTYLDANAKKPRAPARPSAASSATSPAASGTSSSHPRPTPSTSIS
jgi:transposase